MIILDPQRGSASIVSLALAGSDSDGDGPGLPPGAAGSRQPGALSDSDTDFESGLTGTAHWQDIDEEDDCPDSVCGEPGEKYWKIL